jgi:outer membrane protein assembly factor BamB
MKTKTLILILSIWLFGTSFTYGIADDFEWPRWRGPDRNGIYRETDWYPEALAGGPEVLWHVNIGMGNSNVAIRDGRLYSMGATKEGESVLCLDALTGEEIWRYNYNEPLRYPQATPTIEGKYIYALSYEGVVLCLKAKNGKLKWKRDLVEDFGALKPDYGYASSPAVEGDLIVINTKNTAYSGAKLPPIPE